jgi:DNA repair exonuclease SbcCD ATPase subunit
MKTILPWLLVIAFGASAGALFFSGTAKDTQLAELHAQVQQMDAMRAQVDDLQKQAAANAEQVASMQKDNEELLKLRNQVKQLGDEKAQLTKQLTAAQTQAARSQAEVQQVQARVTENAKQMAEQQILQARQNASAVNACINNLRLLDAAKQQWALENNKTGEAVPQPQDILPYVGANGQFPQCPGGGRYTLNAVNQAPTCSIPGHALPQVQLR